VGPNPAQSIGIFYACASRLARIRRLVIHVCGCLFAPNRTKSNLVKNLETFNLYNKYYHHEIRSRHACLRAANVTNNAIQKGELLNNAQSFSNKNL
jgi:hypothetical protein